MPWEILAAIEKHAGSLDQHSATGKNGNTPAGPYRFVRDNANNLAKQYGYEMIDAAGVRDQVKAGISLGRAFEAILTEDHPGAETMLIDAGATSGSPSPRRSPEPSRVRPRPTPPRWFLLAAVQPCKTPATCRPNRARGALTGPT